MIPGIMSHIMMPCKVITNSSTRLLCTATTWLSLTQFSLLASAHYCGLHGIRTDDLTSWYNDSDTSMRHSHCHGFNTWAKSPVMITRVTWSRARAQHVLGEHQAVPGTRPFNWLYLILCISTNYKIQIHSYYHSTDWKGKRNSLEKQWSGIGNQLVAEPWKWGSQTCYRERKVQLN